MCVVSPGVSYPNVDDFRIWRIGDFSLRDRGRVEMEAGSGIQPRCYASKFFQNFWRLPCSLVELELGPALA